MSVQRAIDRLTTIRNEQQDGASPESTLEKLKELTNFCHQVGTDPSFVDIYAECATVAEQNGGMDIHSKILPSSSGEFQVFRGEILRILMQF